MDRILGYQKNFSALKRRTSMAGAYERVYETGMKMYRIMNNETEEFSTWFSSSEAQELKEMDEDMFFATAEKSIQDAKNSSHEQTGDTKTEL